MIYWINFLHIYQPPTQEPEVLKKIVDESYSQILDLLDQHAKLKITLNISGSLLEKFEENHHQILIERFKAAVSRGQIELTGSAMYHPILPLIPEAEVRDQIELNTKKIKEIFGENYPLKGFYFPEMAYSKKTAQIVRELGFQWIILDELHFGDGKPNNEIKYEIKDVGLNVFFRSRKYSKSFPPKSVFQTMGDIKERYLITAHDGEMYGHWHKDEEGFFKKSFEHNDILFLKASEYLDKLSESAITDPIETTWESLKEELQKNILFALWNDPENKIHVDLWDLVNLIYPILVDSKEDPNYLWAKKHFDRGISSCLWWWASGRKIDVLSPISWNPTEIEKGLTELVKSIRSLKKLKKEKKLEIEKKYHDLLELIWSTHWNKNTD